MDQAVSRLYAENPTGRFSNRAEDYAKYRPTYPPEAIALILSGLGNPTGLAAADVGAGTGISARLLADRGVRVVAIEPNIAMREAAEAHPGVEFWDGTAEQTRLLAQSIDLVLCCQSFHWFNQPLALAEFHRILKPRGRLALMWNDRDETDAFTGEHGQIIHQFADRRIYSDKRRKSPELLAHSLLFRNFRSEIFQHVQRLDREGLIGLVLSASYVPKTGDAHEQLIQHLSELFDRWADAAGEVALAYSTYLYWAEPVDAGDSSD
ncbi:class I SAM-dependent methyltransferase [Phormidium tenue FACHB-886]|nr:class I SAM-dependent methyltransferase [Phormidium tenue FACHB-886]